MGCTVSGLEKTEMKTIEVNLMCSPYVQLHDTLTEKQIQLVKETWLLLENQDQEELGLLVFGR